jgi:DNA-binding Lrp family transcriptional regulator
MLDDKDKKILESLKKNARETTTNIARKLKLKRVTVHDRIKRLVERNIIQSFTIRLNYDNIEMPTTVFLFVSITPNNVSHRELAEIIARLPGVYEVYMVTGKYDLLVKIRGKSIEDIGRIVIDRIRVLKGVGQTFTSACFETVKEEF